MSHDQRTFDDISEALCKRLHAERKFRIYHVTAGIRPFFFEFFDSEQEFIANRLILSDDKLIEMLNSGVQPVRRMIYSPIPGWACRNAKCDKYCIFSFLENIDGIIHEEKMEQHEIQHDSGFFLFLFLFFFWSPKKKTVIKN